LLGDGTLLHVLFVLSVPVVLLEEAEPSHSLLHGGGPVLHMLDLIIYETLVFHVVPELFATFCGQFSIPINSDNILVLPLLERLWLMASSIRDAIQNGLQVLRQTSRELQVESGLRDDFVGHATPRMIMFFVFLFAHDVENCATNSFLGAGVGPEVSLVHSLQLVLNVHESPGYVVCDEATVGAS